MGDIIFSSSSWYTTLMVLNDFKNFKHHATTGSQCDIIMWKYLDHPGFTWSCEKSTADQTLGYPIRKPITPHTIDPFPGIRRPPLCE